VDGDLLLHAEAEHLEVDVAVALRVDLLEKGSAFSGQSSKIDFLFSGHFSKIALFVSGSIF